VGAKALDRLKFSKEKERLTAEAKFLTDVLKGRTGSAAKLQDDNAEAASKILEDSIKEYLGKPPKSKEEQG
jgi:hypothetical protein